MGWKDEASLRGGSMSTDALLESIIGGIKESYKTTNIVEVDLSGVPFSPEKRIGHILLAAQNISNREFALNFDPVETIYLQKLITEPTLNQRVVLEKDDYLQGMLYLDFLTTFISRDAGVFERLAGLDQRIERVNPSMGINLEICVKFVAMNYAAQSLHGRKTRPISKRTFEQDNSELQIQNPDLRRLNPVYFELGKIVYQMLELPETKEQVASLGGRADLKALVFTDTNLRYIKDQAEKEKVIKRLSRGDFYNAALRSMYALASEVNQRAVDGAIKDLEKRYEERR